jgi:Peptidase family M28
MRLLALLLTVLLSALGARAEAGSVELATAEELAAAVREAPCKNKDRLEAVQQLFLDAGVPREEIRVERFERVQNVVVTLPGSGDEQIYLGAHYDKTRDGCGAIDNWSGVVVLAQIWRTLHPLPLAKTVHFVAFGREEEGLIGSRAMTKELGDAERQRTCAMINVDSLGLSWPQVASNLSCTSLTDATRDLAARMNIRYSQEHLKGDSDSTPFLDHDIPALTIHGLPGDYGKILHTFRDKATLIKPESLYLGYRLVLGLVGVVDQAPCQSWR